METWQDRNLSLSQETVWLSGINASNSSNVSFLDSDAIYLPSDVTMDQFKHMLLAMRLYYTPTLAVTGSLTNLLTGVILLRSSLHHVSGSHYMAASAIANSFHLISLLLEWLTQFDIDLYNTPVGCHFISFFHNVVTFLSTWLVVAFAVDRCIIVCLPARFGVLCTPLRAKCVIVGIVLVACVVHMNISLTVGLQDVGGRMMCMPLDMFVKDLYTLLVFDVVVNVIIAHAAILALTLVIMCRLLIQKVARQDGRATSSTTGENGSIMSTRDSVVICRCHDNDNHVCTCDTEGGSPTSRAPSRSRSIGGRRRNRKLVKLTVTYLTVVCVAQLPFQVFTAAHVIVGILWQSPEISRLEHYCKVLAEHVFHTSLACHFVVCLLCQPEFARVVLTSLKRCTHAVCKALLLCRRYRKRGGGREGIPLAPVDHSSGTTTVTYV